MGEFDSAASTHLISLAEGVATIRQEQAAERQLLRQAGQMFTRAARQAKEEADRRRAEERLPLVMAFMELVTAASVRPEPFQRWTDRAPVENRVPMRGALKVPRMSQLRPATITIAVRPPTRTGWQIYDTVSGQLNYDPPTTMLNHVRHSYLYITPEAEIVESDTASDLTEFPPLPIEIFAHALAVCLVNNGVIQAPPHSPEGLPNVR